MTKGLQEHHDDHDPQEDHRILQGLPEDVGLLPTRPTAAQATAMDWGEISLPMTPPNRFAEVVRTGFRPSWMAVTCWSLPNRAAEEVTEPVRNTPSRPMTGEKMGKAMPVRTAKARPRVKDMPE